MQNSYHIHYPRYYDTQMKCLVSIIIPTRNRCDLLKSCLRSIYQSTYRNYEIIVVDNGSSDGTAAMVQAKYPEARFIETGKNLFLARGRNLGIRMAQGQYFLFIDDDNEIEPRMIEELVSLCKLDDRIGLVGPKMYYYGSEKLFWWTGASINLLTSRTVYRGLNSPDTGLYDQPDETGHIPNVVMMKREVYDIIGGFDEVYEMSYADSDYAMRAVLTGYKIMYCPKAIAYHKIPLPHKYTRPFKLPMRAYYFARNRAIYMKKFARGVHFLLFMLIFYPLFTLWYSVRTILSNDASSTSRSIRS